MGVTEVRHYFTQIVGHNSMNVHRIPTKLGTEICLNEPIKYSKFQLDRSTCLHFMADFVKCVKRSRRKILVVRVSEMSGAIFFKFGM